MYTWHYLRCCTGLWPNYFQTASTNSLLFSILRYRWQYFYVSQVRLGYSPGCSEVEAGPDTPCHPEQLLSVLRVFGQSLLQQDINIFRLSLAALEDLNSKWKLYHKVRKLMTAGVVVHGVLYSGLKDCGAICLCLRMCGVFWLGLGTCVECFSLTWECMECFIQASKCMECFILLESVYNVLFKVGCAPHG